MSHFVFAQNVENTNAANAAQSATNKREMNLADAYQRVIDLLVANDGVSHAIIIHRNAENHTIYLQINQALPREERYNIARALRPSILAMNGKKLYQYINGKCIAPDTWRIDENKHQEAILAWEKRREDARLMSYWNQILSDEAV